MRSRFRGFVEGTSIIEKGESLKYDGMKRNKYECKYFSCTGCSYLLIQCPGSSHCKYYDIGNGGYKEDYNTSFLTDEQKERLYEFSSALIDDMWEKVNYNSIEGKFILNRIKRKYLLSRPNIEEAERQIQEFKKESERLRADIDEYDYCLMQEINEHNLGLQFKCCFLGLLIVTIPFCLGYYFKNKRDYVKENKRDFNRENILLREKIVNQKLQSEVERYYQSLKEYTEIVEEYKELSRNATVPLSRDEYCVWYNKAKISYQNGDLKNFYFQVIKSIEKNNKQAITLLANVFEDGRIFNRDMNRALLLQLYSSYLGDKTATKEITDKLFFMSDVEDLREEFLKKSNG